MKSNDRSCSGRDCWNTSPSYHPRLLPWQNVIPFFAFPPDVRKVIYTTNAVENLHMQLRKIIKSRGHFPSNEAATKLLWLTLRNIKAGKVRSTREWKGAMNQFAMLYGDRFVNPKN